MIIPNSCIFYLVYDHPTHLKRLEASLKLLSNNFLSKFPYTVVFGHEGISSTTKDLIREHAPKNHFFHKVDFKLPDYPEHILKQIPEKFAWDGMWDNGAFFSMGYRHMCRWFSGGMYLDSFFDNVNYLLRLDCDSYILKEVENDPFQEMVKNDSIYGYVDEFIDHPNVIEGLTDLCDEIAPTSKDLQFDKAYETNFFVQKCDWFRSKKWMDFFRAIDKTGYIYSRRWGDAPIHYQGINRLVPDDKVIKIDISYHHGGDYHEGL